MEQLKLIDKEKNDLSSFIAKLKGAYPYYFEKLEEIELVSMFSLYEKELEKYDLKILDDVFKKITSTSKFMPSLNEIITYCDEVTKENNLLIIEKMRNDGYFKAPQEYDKILMWLDKGIIPSWFREDMKAYEK